MASESMPSRSSHLESRQLGNSPLGRLSLGKMCCWLLVLAGLIPWASQSFAVSPSRSLETALLLNSPGQVEIEGDEAGRLSFASTLFSVNEASGSATITFRREGSTVGAVMVGFTTAAGGSASPGDDYQPTLTTVSWGNGDGADKTATVSIFDDATAEPTETVDLVLSSPTNGAVLGTPSEATLEILDDESGGPGNCTENPTTLCLQGDRFRITADWIRPNGQNGVGMGVELTDDTGYFWFFNAANVEMVLKVLRGCSNNGNYWVFAGGLTNVQVDIRVEDTLTGEVQNYRNPLRTAFQPIQDTEAFPTCP
ncbi:MAG: hypothetical protein K0U98_12575 [Deltaproteobacteria bacterium]|nr:hypothetical protein [Deltaproteobacteria bacterium]